MSGLGVSARTCAAQPYSDGSTIAAWGQGSDPRQLGGAGMSVRQEFGQGFYWAYNYCLQGKDWKEAQKYKFTSTLKNKCVEVYRGVRPSQYGELNDQPQVNAEITDQEIGEQIRNLRYEILAMNDEVKKALMHKGDLLKSQAAQTAKNTAVNVGQKAVTAVPRYLMTGGLELVKDVEEVAEKLVPDLVTMAGDFGAEKKDNITFYAKAGLRDHALMLLVARQLIQQLTDEDRLDNKFEKSRKRILFKKTVTLRHECEKLEAACATYEKSLDDLMGEKESWEEPASPSTPLLIGKSDDDPVRRTHRPLVRGASDKNLHGQEAMDKEWGRISQSRSRSSQSKLSGNQ
jgi:hypothetical protein